MANIDFGIDLGTTNSGIGKFQNGKVNVYKNPVGFRETLPSVVAYRNGRILIGDKAREFTKIQPGQVFSSFKRKMGSDYIYNTPLNEQKTAIDFSTLILKELLNFVGEEKPKAAVITIPASFDTIQSNATKTAGHNAGLSEVALLQEPIAACLAYANTQSAEVTEDKKWLVYDFGGGTFDVALVNISDRDLRVIDHEGNNFLGGVDIDQLMVEHLLCPQLEQLFNESGLWKKMVNGENSDYNKLFVELAYKAEEAKKELSINETTYVEVDFNGNFAEIEIKREQFNKLIQPKVEETIKLTKLLLEKNNIQNVQIDRIILVGGTTYIPYIRTSLASSFNCYVDSTIDPTTAIIVGASYFAGTRMLNETTAIDVQQPTTQTEHLKDVKLVYEINSQDPEELLTGLVPNEFSGYYRITRSDGGFDTGIMPFHSRFNEFLRLLPKSINYFNVKIFDKQQQVVFEKDRLAINHGIYNISGQPLPNDICIEVDDTLGTTFLERVFKKNEILPLSKKIYKTISKTILKGTDDKLIINIVEGNAATSPASNLGIGYLEINAADLAVNLLKGTDIEINFGISESRDLTIGIFIDSINLEKQEVFNASSRKVSIEKMRKELENVLGNIDAEIEEFSYNENDQIVDRLNAIRIEIIELLRELIEIEDDVVTDKIFNIDERKRKVFQQFDQLVRGKNILSEIEEYQAYKQEIKEELLLRPNPKIDRTFSNVIKNEQLFLNSGQLSIIRSKTKELKRLARELYYQNDEAYIPLFYDYAHLDLNEYDNHSHVKMLITKGEQAIEKRNFQELKAVISGLYNQLKVKPKDYLEDQNGTLGLR
ncbi:MAG: Hsp70 family protein [Pedobacter sp.]|uniref:Hsp70 family protein n=1 Tax=Pedobacter sp. TaxID=1411316 RepID=UPI002808CF76|nr:Hsp70 family protein [Pedobacter sp.]MDQ8005048.1 Hsp70 family protein [Pedobacter sp.]